MYSICQRLEDDYKVDHYGSSAMLDHILYNTKPDAYQIQLAIIKDQINTKEIC
jgi:hypothetical protein